MTTPAPLKVLYLVHDLSDPAVCKRVAMLQEGGTVVTLAGFRRTNEIIDNIAGCSTINLGQTYNSGFVQRIWSVLREVACLGKYRALFANSEIIIARNLEMLAIGVRGKILSSGLSASSPVLVYECLDIHRLLLNEGLAGKALRYLEGWLAKRASALITSSPAFISEYFNARSQIRLPIRLIENKIYPSPKSIIVSNRKAGPPWRIGWSGAIRCRKSLAILEHLVRQSNGSIEVIIRGRPSLDQFDDFNKSIKNTPGMTFLGPYKNPDDLEIIYRDVHFSWAIDMFEEGLNSSWLLPNRLYEGCAYGAVPIAASSVETGKFINRLGIGVALAEPKNVSLESFFRQLTTEQYGSLEKSVINIPKETWIASQQDCTDLALYLRSLQNPHYLSGNS